MSVARQSSVCLFLLAFNNPRQKKKAVVEVSQKVLAGKHVKGIWQDTSEMSARKSERHGKYGRGVNASKGDR